MSCINLTPMGHLGTFGKPGFLSPRGPRGGAAGPPEGAERAAATQSHVMAAARVLLLVSGRPESVSFAQSVCGRLGAGPGLGPWPTHCGLKRGQLLLSDKPFPGASARLPLQVRKGTPARVVKGRRRGLGPGRSRRRDPGRPATPTRLPPSHGVSQCLKAPPYL